MAGQAKHKARAKAVAIKRSKQFNKNNEGIAELRRFVRTFEKFPKDLRKDLKTKLIASVQAPLRTARANAAWSSRIPGAIRVRTSFTKRSAGVALEVNRHKAPHARAHEGLRQNATFRAPTGVPREPWVAHRTRPFLARAVGPWQKQIDKDIVSAVDSVARSHGFR